MSRHLSPREFADAMDGRLAAGRLSHLEACGACRTEMDKLRAIADDVQSASDVPEPSPLFWTYFSERVREATSAEPIPSVTSPWMPIWRPLIAAGLAMAVLAFVVFTRQTSGTLPPEEAFVAEGSAGPDVVSEDASWYLVLTLASELEFDDVRQAATPRWGTADAVIDELTPEQRKQLARLIRAEIGDD